MSLLVTFGDALPLPEQDKQALSALKLYISSKFPPVEPKPDSSSTQG